MSKKNDTRMTTTETRDYARQMMEKATAPKTGTMVVTSVPGVELEMLDTEKFAELAKEYQISAPVLEIAEGQIFKGKLVGEGDPIEMASKGKDPATGAPLPGDRVTCWEFVHQSGVSVRLMGGHQLDSTLPKRIGQDLFLVKMAKKKTNSGREVREWLIGNRLEIDAPE